MAGLRKNVFLPAIIGIAILPGSNQRGQIEAQHFTDLLNRNIGRWIGGENLRIVSVMALSRTNGRQPAPPIFSS
jgi:hypothetical protein